VKSARILSPVVHSSDSRKLRRHILLQVAMRRAAKKRAEAAEKVLSELPLIRIFFRPLPSMIDSRTT
jgi:hypothetical protein